MKLEGVEVLKTWIQSIEFNKLKAIGFVELGKDGRG